jgi:VanZ family protein
MSTLLSGLAECINFVKNFLSRWLPLILWAALIFTISGNQDPYQWLPAGWRLPFDASNPDGVSADGVIGRVLHVVEYAVLAWLLLRLLVSNGAAGKKELMAAMVLSMLYALSDEVHQLFVPNRAFELADLGLDLVGVLAGLWIATVVRKSNNKKARQEI